MDKNQKVINSFDINRLSFIMRKSLYKKNIDNNTNEKIIDLKSLSSFKPLTKIKNLKKEKIFKSNNNLNSSKNEIHNNQKIPISFGSNFKKEFKNILQKKISLKFETISQIELIKSLLKAPQERTIEDIHLISFFISGNSLIDNFLKFSQKNQKDIEKLIYEISFRIKYKYVPKNEIIFRIGDIPDNFYMIMNGTVEVLKPIKYSKKINGFEYFKILMNYYINEEFFMLNEVIEFNHNSFEIKKDDLTKIKLLFVKLELDEYFYSSGEIRGENIIQIIKECFCENEILNKINLDEKLIIDAKNPNNRKKINKLRGIIYKFIPSNFSSKIKAYLKIYDKINLKEVTILKYAHIVNLKDNEFFGDSAFDTKSNRNATIVTLEDTHLFYLESDHYDLFLRPEKRAQRLSDINFLLDNFFFNSLNIGTFETNLFNNFIYEEIPNNYILFKQNTPCDYLYFVRNGEIELSTYSSIVQIYFLTKFLSKLNLENNIHEYFKKMKNFDKKTLEPGFKNSIDFLKKELTSKKNYFLFNALNKDIIGLESLIFNIPYLYNAKVVSKTAIIYKIEKKVLFQLIKHNGYLIDTMLKEGKEKMKILLERIIKYNSLQIKIVDDNFTKRMIYKKFKKQQIKNINISDNKEELIIKNDIYKEKNIFNNNCLSEERKIPIIKSRQNFDSYNNLQKNLYIKNLKFIPNNKKKSILILDKNYNKINEEVEKYKTNNFFFTQPLFKNKKLSKINYNIENINNKDNFSTSDEEEDILSAIKNELNKNRYLKNSNKNPYLLRTFVNFDKIKKFKLRHSLSSQNNIGKKIKIINAIKL